MLGQQYSGGSDYSSGSRMKSIEDPKTSLIRKLGHQALMLMRACVKLVGTSGRGLKLRSEEEKRRDNEALHRLADQVFPEVAVRELVDTVVTQIMLLQPDDLREWEDEPDEWEKRDESEGADYEFSPKACAEKLLFDLGLVFKEPARKRILELLGTVTGQFTIQRVYSKLVVLTHLL